MPQTPNEEIRMAYPEPLPKTEPLCLEVLLLMRHAHPDHDKT